MEISKIFGRVYSTLVNRELELSAEQKILVEALDSLDKPKSVFFFTMHKCASSFMNKLFTAIAGKSDYKLTDYGKEIWNLSDYVDIVGPYEDFLEKSYERLYMTRGVIYAPQRNPLFFPGVENFRHIFFLRDPRDAVVSSYYSTAFSHDIPKGSQSKQRFDTKRRQAQEQGIDEYTLQAAVDWLIPLYANYRKLRESSYDYLYLTYDEFKDDTEKFIYDIAQFLNVPVSSNVVSTLSVEASPIQVKKNIYTHKRSGKSQQYLDELKPETVTTLNDMFVDTLDYWRFKR